MAGSMNPILQRQLARVSRRLFVQTLLDALAWCLTLALLLGLVWFLVEPYLITSPPEWLRWAVAGGLVGLGAVVAVVVAVVRAPSRLAAALSIDERFGLKERVTTSLTLAPGLESTPAGAALLADVAQHVSGLDVGSGFPVKVGWNAALVPVCVVALALVALFYEPQITQAKPNEQPTPADIKVPQANQEEIKKKLEGLVKKPEKREDAREKSKELEKIEAELRDLVNRPNKTQEQLRDRAKEVTDLEAMMKQEQKKLAEKSQALKDQLKAIDRMSKKDDKGATKDLEKALAKGDFEKAQEEVDKLQKKMKNNELTEEDKKELKNKLDKLQDKLERLSKQQDQIDKLKEMAKKGELDQDALDRELDRLNKDSENLKELKDLSDDLKNVKENLEKGNDEQAEEALERIKGRLQKMAGNDQDAQDLQDQLERLQDAKRAVGQSMAGGQPNPASGRRPEDKDGDFKPLPSRVNVDFDKNGQKEIVDFVPGRSFKKKSSSEIAGEVKQASQEAPEAIERQRIPRAASEIAKGYYEKLRKQAEKEQDK